jgi:hypothetical protein
MCKEMPVIPVNKVVNPKRVIGTKMEGQGGGEAQGVADPQKTFLNYFYLAKFNQRAILNFTPGPQG